MSSLERQAKALSARVAAIPGLARKRKPVPSPYVRSKSLRQQLSSFGGVRPLKEIERSKRRMSESGIPFVRTPVKGTDYFTPEDIAMIRDVLLGEVRGMIAAAQKVDEVQDREGTIEITQEMVRDIVQKMHSLPEADKLEVSKGLRNAQSFIYSKTKYDISELMHGGGSSGSGGATYYTPTGTVDASNVSFGVTAQPTSVISDGVTYFEGAGYTYAALTITLDVPPSQYVRYTL